MQEILTKQNEQYIKRSIWCEKVRLNECTQKKKKHISTTNGYEKVFEDDSTLIQEK